ncbi:Dimer_Tnp_hAT domain-containing protein [Senna tora]|uniref:Dimer_Tnp_hAT domain-containing protein n=1 Tax=Senna tora TaxID=362788 RepID=A0A834T2Z9_9FABA|nr:Dimer_Tnp_hAT domain-containing protein [Senna tora]
MYGSSAPLLQNLVLKLLSQPCSSSCCERNLSTYSFIHSVRRNKITPKRAEDLVFVHTNLRLLSRRSSKYKDGETKMWDIGGDRWEHFDGPGTLEVASLSLDEPELEANLLAVDGGENDEIPIVETRTRYGVQEFSCIIRKMEDAQQKTFGYFLLALNLVDLEDKMEDAQQKVP